MSDHHRARRLAAEPIWRRFQIEIGIRWEMAPRKGLTWAKWAWDPFAIVIWPGRRIAYKDSPENCWSEPWTEVGSYDSESRSAIACYYWASCAMRLLGLDVGAAIVYRPEARS